MTNILEDDLYGCDARQIGAVAVDAGVVMIGDPCYHYNDVSEASDWPAFCDALTGVTGTTPVEPLGPGLGIVVETPWGDGTYPVVGMYRHDRLVGVAVLFDRDVDDDY